MEVEGGDPLCMTVSFVDFSSLFFSLFFFFIFFFSLLLSINVDDIRRYQSYDRGVWCATAQSDYINSTLLFHPQLHFTYYHILLLLILILTYY